MRNETKTAVNAAEAIKGAGVLIAAEVFALIERLEQTGYLATLPVSEDETLTESLIETIASSGHFEKLHGDDIEAYRLFVAAAKAETLDARTLEGKLALRAMDDAQQTYIDAQLGDREDVRVGDLESAS